MLLTCIARFLGLSKRSFKEQNTAIYAPMIDCAHPGGLQQELLTRSRHAEAARAVDIDS